MKNIKLPFGPQVGAKRAALIDRSANQIAISGREIVDVAQAHGRIDSRRKPG